MSDDDIIRSLAAKSGIDTIWRSTDGEEHIVSVETLRAILTAIGLACSTREEAHNSLSIAELGQSMAGHADFVTARAGHNFVLPIGSASVSVVEVELENGSVRSVTPVGLADGLITLPAFETPGYHKIRLADAEFTVAVAPERCVTLADLTEDRGGWGLAAQIYSLRRAGDGGVGDFGSAADLVRAAATRGADMLALSPVHALFAAEPNHYSPYSPSSRLFYNPMHADPRIAFPSEAISEAIELSGVGAEMHRLEGLPRVDWPAAHVARYKLLRTLYERMVDKTQTNDAAQQDFERFRSNASALLIDHCTFEALHAWHLAQPNPQWAWHDWSAEYRDPDSATVREFRRTQHHEIDFHLFLQWLSGRSYADCQRICREAGMRVGLIADLAIGMDGSGSHAWSRQHEVLGGVSIGAPPDFYNADGQTWGLTGFSPRGLVATGFAPFIETLRASMRHAGGIRIDHAMGMSRLWLVPKGAKATEGGYLNFPSESMFRLIALESWRHKALVIGEDLGTLPHGFRDHLRHQGIAGLRVLRFERDQQGFFNPDTWDPAAMAMTTTHDLVPTAGWWAATDLETVHEPEKQEAAEALRAWDRGLLWSAFQRTGLVSEGERPVPDDTDPVVDGAVAFVGRTGSIGKLLAIEDIVGARDQPNVPGTVGGGNWSHRLSGPATTLIDGDDAMRRIISVGGHAPKIGPHAESEAAE